MNTYLKILPFILIIILVGCDIFEVRNPENPTDTKSGYRVPVEPKDVIQNIINSFRDRNANDYEKNFAGGPPLVSREFLFVPSGNVLSSFPADWALEQEFQYFNNLVSRTPQDIPITLTFSNEFYDVRGDSTIYSTEYSISVPLLNSEPELYGGSLKFTMVTDINSAWVIYFWEDIAKAGAKSWSELKIEFYL
ncbi:MAG: hypothetical protein WBQ32_08565 [Ignavibacteriaceae bacterium]